MEETKKIKTFDDNIIYGTLTHAKRECGNLIIFVHGLYGNQREHIFHNAAKFFPDKGFSTFRFDLYSHKIESRKFKESTISIHANDLKEVIRYFRGIYGKIHLVGHSLGCIIISVSELDSVHSIVFWDPSIHPKNVFSELKYLHHFDGYVMECDLDVIVGKDMMRDANNLPSISELLKNINKPIKIISAGKTGCHWRKDIYFSNVNHPKSFYCIKKAGHHFDEEDSEEKLFQETLIWLDRYRI